MPVVNLASGAVLAVNSLGASLLPIASPTTSSVADIEAKIKELGTHIQGLHATTMSFASQGPGSVSETLVRSLAFPRYFTGTS